MALNDFTDNYLNQLMAKMAGNKNNVFFSGDFNIELMKNDIDAYTSTFLDLLTSNLFYSTYYSSNKNYPKLQNFN